MKNVLIEYLELHRIYIEIDVDIDIDIGRDIDIDIDYNGFEPQIFNNLSMNVIQFTNVSQIAWIPN